MLPGRLPVSFRSAPGQLPVSFRPALGRLPECDAGAEPVANKSFGIPGQLSQPPQTKHPPAAASQLQLVRNSRLAMYLAAAIAPRRRGKPARRQSGPLGKPSAQRFIPFNGSLCRETMGKLAGHQNTCERDTSRNRTRTAVQGRFYNPPGAQVGIGRATCARRKS